MLVLMLILRDHKFKMVFLLFSVYLELQLADFIMRSQTHVHHQFYLFKLSVVDPS
jgi:hypothetical protein